MEYKKLFIGISITTTVPFFSSVIRTGEYSAQTPSHLSDFHESVVKGKYKSPFYKLWQYAAKNKPSLYNDDVVHYHNKRYSQVKRIFAWYKCFLKFFLQLEEYIKHVTSTELQRSSLLKSRIFLYHSNNIGLRSLPYFISHVDLIPWIFTYTGNLLRKEKNNYKEYFKLNNSVFQIYKIKGQRQKAPNKIGVYINKILHNKVYC
ncbi:hypothetical protein D1093_00730 [Bartonella kosoyi]|uniref:Uncharacterized protein n=1 Tax=Bartonella kosoyi TaxID=2133959 RepID=A0A5B9CUN1_9HYPH|nr:hypothetical protein [Bartonella kosoyi]QEE08204.1 hypothetical protein D1093_00730 [Bartonella kosoyi]